ncbi:MAG: hypothetical protein M1825_003193 [Sarcosagium campestre]|nr:MAG: hypothetical protein M1825_003193 [Sarcosagium campestre]
MEFFASTLGDWLSIWHSSRAPILLALVLTVLAFHIFARLRRARRKQSPSPISLSPKANAVDDSLLQWRQLKAENSTSISRSNLEKVDIISPLSPSSNKETRKTSPKRVIGKKLQRKKTSGEKIDGSKVQVVVFFSSLTGSTERCAKSFVDDLSSQLTSCAYPEKFFTPQLHDLSYIDHDDYFVSPPKIDRPEEDTKFFYLLLVPTYNIDTIINIFLSNLEETHHDFRIDTAPLSSLLGYSVFGFGDRQGWPTEAKGFCSQAKEIDTWMAKLTGRKRAFPLGMGDTSSDAITRLNEWRIGVTDALIDAAVNGLGEGVAGSGDPLESDEEDLDDVDQDDNGIETSKVSKLSKGAAASDLGDLEDIGRSIGIGKKSSKSSASSPASQPSGVKSDLKAQSAPAKVINEMVPKSSPTYASLTKQGYTIVGSHSGVKICRWTKSALRGRGSCYKYSFYGIQSHLCMETTPSLSCSNKCVFCWRHGTNPVGTTWRWKIDPPDMIFAGVKEGHYKKIRMMKGVPGVRAERFAEAFRIRHCALSLVGEPIFYPHINELTALLHSERISTFLVCNAQHPDQLAALKPVTQLYVSIDASNRDSLKKIDRPLHRDFWERFVRCLDILRERRFTQRTVYRLTLVKGFNIDDEAEGYADLVARGLPCFVEVKGVTYCGTSSSAGAGLTMQNVPFYSEVSAFAVALTAALDKRGLAYGIAAEHAHSCCILIASERFLVDGKWHTPIDYDGFFKLLDSGEPFAPEDYMGPPTPDWACWGNGGFDPRDERVDRKGRKKIMPDPDGGEGGCG